MALPSRVAAMLIASRGLSQAVTINEELNS